MVLRLFFMVCCVIGHRDVLATEELEQKVKNTFTELIRRGVTMFLLGSRGKFNSLALSCLRELKKDFCDVFKIVYVRAEYLYIDDDYKQYLLNIYDDTYAPECVEKANRAVYVARNRHMIDKSDICVFFYNDNAQEKSGTRKAYLYALKTTKEIINLYNI